MKESTVHHTVRRYCLAKQVYNAPNQTAALRCTPQSFPSQKCKIDVCILINQDLLPTLNCILSHCSPKFGKGSGFIAELEITRAEKKVVLMTCNHVLPSLAVAQKASIYFGRRSRTNPGIIIEGQELFNDRYFLTDDRTVSLVCCLKVQLE